MRIMNDPSLTLPDSKEAAHISARNDIRASLVKTEKGHISNCLANFVRTLQEDPVLKGAICLNLLTERVDMLGDLGWPRSDSSAITDTDLHYLALHLEKHYGLSSEKKLRSAVDIVANENRYHPIRDKLSSLTWDGIPRIRNCLHHFLGAAEDDYTQALMQHFLLGAIRRIFHPGCKYEEILCLVGGQGIGKSTFLRFLAMEDEWFSDDIRRLDDDKIFQRLVGHWIIEMSEMLATNNAKSVEESRSFFSRQKDTYRVPYETQPRDRQRQCVFAGTSNSMDFLPLDRAGNRRFLPVLCDGEQAACHILDNEKASRAYIEQVWAEAMAIYRKGTYSMQFSKAIREQLVKKQRDFMPEDVTAGKIVEFLARTDHDRVCCQMLHTEALNRPGEPKKWESHEYCEIMKNYAPAWRRFDTARSFGARYGKQKGWERLGDADDTEFLVNQPHVNQLHFTQIPAEEALTQGMPREFLSGKDGQLTA